MMMLSGWMVLISMVILHSTGYFWRKGREGQADHFPEGIPSDETPAGHSAKWNPSDQIPDGHSLDSIPSLENPAEKNPHAQMVGIPMALHPKRKTSTI